MSVLLIPFQPEIIIQQDNMITQFVLDNAGNVNQDIDSQLHKMGDTAISVSEAQQPLKGGTRSALYVPGSRMLQKQVLTTASRV